MEITVCGGTGLNVRRLVVKVTKHELAIVMVREVAKGSTARLHLHFGYLHNIGELYFNQGNQKIQIKYN